MEMMAKNNFEGKLAAASSEEKLKAAKQLLKNAGLSCAWRNPDGRINATFQDHNTYNYTEVIPGDPAVAQCSCREKSGKLCEHAVAAIMYCGRFNPNAIKPIDDGVSNYAGLKFETLESLVARDGDRHTAFVTVEAASAFPHVPSKWENAVLNIRLRNAEREYLGNVNNLRQLFFDKKLSISLKLDDFPLQDQQIIRFLAINGEPDNSSVLLNSEQTAEFFHCLVGFERFTREGRKLMVRGESAEPVILRNQTRTSTKISPGIRVNQSLLPIRNAKVITGRAGCWIGRQGEYYFLPATLDIGWLRNFFRTGEQDVAGKISENFLNEGKFPLPVIDVDALEPAEPDMQILFGGSFDAERRLHIQLRYIYENNAFAPNTGRLAQIDHRFCKRDECGELRWEQELDMFGFQRENGEFVLPRQEAAGVFLDRVLPMWLTSNSNISLAAPLARLCAGGAGLPGVTFRCRISGRTESGYTVHYEFSSPAGMLSLKQLNAAAKAGQNYLVTGPGGIVMITPELRKCIRGLENIIRNHSEKEGLFELPFFSTEYFLHLTEAFPEARPAELVSSMPGLGGCVTAAPPKPDFTFTGELRTYQQEGVEWLRRMTDANFNVILADEMGLGKTVQLLALLASRKLRAGAPALVICPASLVTNWEREAHTFVPDFRVAALANADRDTVWENIDDYDLIVTSYAMARRDADQLRKHKFSYLILDEAQHIKNPGTVNSQNCKSLHADHRIVLTGTPLENSSEDLWSIVDFLHPGMLGTFNAFRSYYADIRESAELQQDLAARVAPFLKRRTKAEVCQELPPKEERMIFCEMLPEQRELYEAIRADGHRQLARFAQGDSRANAEIFTTLLRLRQVCCHPGLLPDAPNVPSAKFELLQELVMEHIDSHHKMLLFSQFTSMLGKITEWLDTDRIPYEYLDGSTRNRQNHVDKFNNDPAIPLFLLSLKAGGTGLNLTSADTVILCDPWWNPAVELQATDRTHRIGQTRPVRSLKLLVKDSIEEKILTLQEQKQEIFDNVVDNPNVAGAKFSIEELKYLLS